MAYVTENHGLSDGQDAVNIRYGLVFLFFGRTVDVVLFDVVQRLLLAAQPETLPETRSQKRNGGMQRGAGNLTELGLKND